MFQVEDLVVAVWLGVVEYQIRRYTGDDILPLIESLDLRVMELTWDTPWAWVAQPGLVMGALLAIALVPLAIVLRGRARRAGPTGSRAALTPGVQRTLIVPAALIGTSLSRGVCQTLVRDSAYSAPALTALHIGLSLLPFLVLVAAPRVFVGATTEWRRWLPRFALFAAAWMAGAWADG
jgi:hypothetical protein